MMRFVLPLAMCLLAACAAPRPDIRPTITQAALATVETPLMLAEVPQTGAQATLIPWEIRDGLATWRTGDFVSLTFRDGIIVGTRGLGYDLMTADVAGARQALTRRGGQYTRHMSYLDGEGQTLFRSMLCEVTSATPERIDNFGAARDTTRVEETCGSLSGAVTNIYWMAGDGLIWRSRQWLSDELGYLATERLVR